MNKSINARHAFLLLVILVIAVIVAVAIIKTAPKPQRASEPKVIRLVETIALERTSERPSWLGGGEISASQRVQLSPQVTGRIEYIAADAVPGAELSKGKLLARIEKHEYQLQVQQKKAALVQAQASLDLEKGQALLAKEEYELAVRQINGRLTKQNTNSMATSNVEVVVADDAVTQVNATPAIDNSLVLREPQIASAKAGVKTAKANLDLSRLNLARTEITMPFNGQIISRSANVGGHVNSNDRLFDVVATDEFWLQVKISHQFLPFLDLTQPVIIQQGEFRREAKILNTLLEVDAQDRQAKVLVSIENPLVNSIEEHEPDQQSFQVTENLLLGSYVDCILFAKPIANAYVIENRYIKEGGFIWVVNNNKLYKRPLEITYQGREKTWVTGGILDADTLLISNLGVVTEGTPVRLAVEDEVDDESSERDTLQRKAK